MRPALDLVSSPVLADTVANPDTLGQNYPRHRRPLDGLFLACVDLQEEVQR